MTRQKPITVVVSRFDDLLQGGLRELLAGDESVEVLAAGIEQQRVAVILAGHQPDVAVLDADALRTLSEVRELAVSHPRTKLVLLAANPTAAVCGQMLAFGASACLDTGTQSRDVLSAIHLAARGMRLTPDVPGADHPASRGISPLLTAKETQVLPMLRQGLSNAQIALGLAVGIETVRTHTRNIYRKLGVSSRRELLAMARPQPEQLSAAPPIARRHLASAGGRTRARRSGLR